MSSEVELMDRIGYRFIDTGILHTALTHSSYVNEHGMDKSDSNERLEFLGDAVLQLVVTDRIYGNLKPLPEGSMTKLRSDIVRESSLSECAHSISLGKHLRLGRGEELSGGSDKPSILADAFEALIGAIYIDGGYEVARDLVDNFFKAQIETVVGRGVELDYKTRLQEILQGVNGQNIFYKVNHACGPDHEKVFYIDVYVGEKMVGTGSGKSKKEAEQNAAMDALGKGDLNVL